VFAKFFHLLHTVGSHSSQRHGCFGQCDNQQRCQSKHGARRRQAANNSRLDDKTRGKDKTQRVRKRTEVYFILFFVFFCSCWLLKKLASNNQKNRDAMRELGVLQRIVPLLSADEPAEVTNFFFFWFFHYFVE
jgi:hypothetical protein